MSSDGRSSHERMPAQRWGCQLSYWDQGHLPAWGTLPWSAKAAPAHQFIVHSSASLEELKQVSEGRQQQCAPCMVGMQPWHAKEGRFQRAMTQVEFDPNAGQTCDGEQGQLGSSSCAEKLEQGWLLCILHATRSFG